MKSVFLSIRVPDGEYCWEFGSPEGECCEHFDNEYREPKCGVGFYDISLKVDVGFLKDPKCAKLKEG